MMKASRSHDAAMLEMLRKDPYFAEAYLLAAIEEMDKPGGQAALATALRHVAEARGGMSKVAKVAGVSRETLYRTLSPRGNPTLKTLNAVLKATGLKLSIRAV